HPTLSLLLLFRSSLSDPAAADDLVALIEDGGLAGGDGALRLVEGGKNAVGGVIRGAFRAYRRERGPGRIVAMANLDLDAQSLAGVKAGHRDPVEAIGIEFAAEQVLVRAHRDLVRARMDLEDVDRV